MTTLILLGLASICRGDNPPAAPWVSVAGTAHGTNASGPPAPGLSSPGNLSEELFGEPQSESNSRYRALQETFADPAVQPARFLEGDWLNSTAEAGTSGGDDWSWHVLPDGLIYRSYLAGVKESRFAGQWVYDFDLGWMWDITLGGRVGILRYGTAGVDRPQGWQLDIEGAGMPRLDLEHEERDLMAADFRFGIPLTYGRGDYQTKFAYYHLSSHLGDEYMVRHETLVRRNYSRDVLVWGHSWFVIPDVRLYGEAGWAMACDGGSEPWEFQFGVDYSPVEGTGQRGSPFVALNAHLRQEFDFGGNLVVQTGWQWRGYTGHLFRVGMHYLQGMSDQWEYYDQYEDKLGLGVWYDF
ncbi:MAG: DUF1207 domain-containing protein [Thermoguttaceae bacterium]